MSTSPAVLNPAATDHLAWFITAPGQSDTLMVVMTWFLVLTIFGVGVFYLRLHALPEHMAHGKLSRTQMDVVGALALLALFTHNHAFWVVALFVAMIQIPDFSTPLESIAASLARLAGREPEQPDIALVQIAEDPVPVPAALPSQGA